MKQNIVVIFGGQSTEHDISRRSVMTILTHIDKSKYNVYKVGITRGGRWLLYEGDDANIIENRWQEGPCTKACISPDATDKALIVMASTGMKMIHIDVVIPVLHGLYGEDGSIQGLLRLAKIPYVGCGILASAVSMDKFYTKLIVDPLGVRQAKYIRAYKETHDIDIIAAEVATQLGYPVFVKPSNAGSSIGVSKATDKTSLDMALSLAYKHDRKVLIEENIEGREVECAVLGNVDVRATDVGEIIAAEEFYDFDAKYNSKASKTVLSADITSETRKKIRQAAIDIFKAVDGRGLSRVDFFIEHKTGDVVFNEINTFPGLTDISMYPMLIEAEGINNRTLIDQLIKLAKDAVEL